MLNRNSIIIAINKAIEPFIIEEGAGLVLCPYKNTSAYRLRISEKSSIAYDNYGTGGEDVTVVKWFRDFWLFTEISFIGDTGVIITVSIFQGKEDDKSKTQLFRAEWDDYGDDHKTHAQPHWHFLTSTTIEKTVGSFAEIVPNHENTFEDLLNEEKSKIVDMSKFHFAMNGDWVHSKIHTHQINDDNALARWFGGLLGYLKTELEFLSNKRGYKE